MKLQMKNLQKVSSYYIMITILLYDDTVTGRPVCENGRVNYALWLRCPRPSSSFFLHWVLGLELASQRGT